VGSHIVIKKILPNLCSLCLAAVDTDLPTLALYRGLSVGRDNSSRIKAVDPEYFSTITLKNGSNKECVKLLKTVGLLPPKA